MTRIIDAYRPYPAPTAPFVMHQSWHNLLFLHWRVPIDLLRRVVPAALPLDTFNGDAYIGVVPFLMRDVRPRFLPAVPRLSFFPELNVRAYVTMNNRPGVYFFSLDAANPLAVEIARTTFQLPYFNATMQCFPRDDAIEYASTRTDARGAPAYFRATYRPTSDAFVAERDTLEYFLTARYCLYTTDAQGNVSRSEIHHKPWELQHAECEMQTNTMLEQIPLPLPDEAPHLLYVRGIDVIVWMPNKV